MFRRANRFTTILAMVVSCAVGVIVSAAVKDGLKLGGKASSRPAVNDKASPAPSRRAVLPVPVAAAHPIELDAKPGDDPEVLWNDYFANHKAAPADVRETVRKLHKARNYPQIIALIQGALRNQQGQPWMYEALGLAMRLDGRPQADIERVLLSALDFSTDPLDVMYLAQYLAKSGFERRALQLFRQVGDANPMAPWPFVNGLRLSQKLDDIDGIKWSTLGILSQAWPKEQIEIWNSAEREAKATLERLRSENRKAEADEYKAALDKALVRDCAVRVTWTGDADVDLLVEEPSGTICSFRNPRTTAGGMMLGDALVRKDDAKKPAASEAYVCTQGFDGKYRLMVRRVWGKVVGDTVTVEVFWHYNSPQGRGERQQVRLIKDEAYAEFELKDGRRKESLSEHQIASAVAHQAEVAWYIVSQQLNALHDERALGSYLTSTYTRQAASAGEQARDFNPASPFFRRRGAVGYSPIISSLPAGAMMRASAVVSADRRYVRVTALPFFSNITEVNTFNFVQGSSGKSNGATSGGFGGLGGGF